MQIDGSQNPRLPVLAPASEARLELARSAVQRGDTEETARQFETLFAVMLVRELRRAMPTGPFGSGAGADVYEGWFDEHLGQALGARDALGIAGLVKAALLGQEGAEQTQESQP